MENRNETRAVNVIGVGDQVVVPEPEKDDAWTFGGFLAQVVDIRENGNCLVEDQDSDIWEVEPARLVLAEEGE